MPTSDSTLIWRVVQSALSIQPKSVLDLGAGMGKYGALLREYLDYGHGRFSPNDWQTQIVGVEGFPAYRNPNWDHYNHVWIENFARKVEYYRDYDLVLMIDSLEHLPFEQAVHTVQELKRNNRNILVSTPSPTFYQPQDAVFGNAYEIHRYKWTPQELTVLGGTHIHTGVCQLFHFPGDK